MNRVVIPKSSIRQFLDGLKSKYKVAAPVMVDGILDFKEIESADQVRLSDEVTYKSPKEFLFPRIERILSFDAKGDIIEENQVQSTAIFGMRPCDLEAFKILTAVFTGGKYRDRVYENRLKEAVLIGMGCISEKPGCFCSERGVDKNRSSECDLFLEDKGINYIAGAFTERGEALIKEFLQDAQEIEDVEGASLTPPLGSEPLELNWDEKTLFEKVDWERISETCIGCGTCTYICPTCHCFEFKDVVEKEFASRYKCWDSCMYPKFTLHTSGHNPRPSKKERYRQRVLHKYLYIKKNFGYTACTGCGRCIRSCPAGMNIKSVVKNIMEELT